MTFIKLTEREKILLEQNLENENKRLARRCKAILLANKEIYSMQEIAEMTGICRTSVHYTFIEWEEFKEEKPKKRMRLLGQMYSGRGAKSKLEPIKDKLPGLVKKYNRRTNKLLQVIDEQYEIKITRVTLQNYLKKLKL